MNDHWKKMVAPVVITILFVIYYIVYFALITSVVEGTWKFLLGIIPIILAGVMIYVCIQRINEIRSGEEDDLGNY